MKPKIIKYYLLMGAILLSASTIAQNTHSNTRASQGMSTGHFYGKVIDENSNKPIESASVQLTKSNIDSATKQPEIVIVAAMLTDRKGEFSIDKLPVFGEYTIIISAVGHSVYKDEVSFNLSDRSQMMTATDKDLGNIKLHIQEKELKGVVIAGTKNMLQMNIDRKVFNVDQSLTSIGGTAEDVMRNVPTVNVDIDGNVTLRNKSPQIFIDGRPTTLALNEIPAGEIESIEIITNPSAKFDASGGGAGILNLVMKKNKKPGYNGNIRTGVDTRGGKSLGGNINIRQNKVNFFASGNYFNFKSNRSTTNNRVDNVNGTKAALFQTSTPSHDGRMVSGNIGLDYLVDNRNTFSISGGIRQGKFNSDELIQIRRDTTIGSITTHDFGTSITSGNFTWNNYNGKLSFRHNFAKPNTNITADVNYSYSENGNERSIATQYFNPDNTPKGFEFRQRTLGSGTSDDLTIQTDYTNPLTDKIKLEAGLRGSVKNSNSESQNFIFNEGSGKFETVTAMNSKYKYKDQVYAGYVTFSQKINNFTYQLGGRIESSKYMGELVDSNQVFENSYPLSFFPSVFLTQKISENQDIQLNYSRKINRPNFYQLIPYYDFSDPLNISKGNASLVPEFTNLFELSYNVNFKKGNNLVATAYFRGTNDLISRYQYWDKNPNPAFNDSVFISSYVNANSSEAFGLEVTSINKIASWWSLTSNVNLYNSKINGTNLESNLDNQRLSWFGKINSTFNLPANFTLQLTGDYTSKTILPPGRGAGGGRHWGGGNLSTTNGYKLPVYGFDVAVKKTFLPDRSLSVSLSMNDIFDTRVTKIHSESNYSDKVFSVQDIESQRDSQNLRLSLSWKFGNPDFSLFKRKNMSRDESGSDMPPVMQ